jgi:glycosyltransferase involved in cell wall biosynthesis
MRIGMILDKTFPPDPRVENEALALKEKGHKVHLFCCYDSKEVTEQEYKGFTLHRYPYGRLAYKLSALAYTVPFYQWLMTPKIRNFIRANSIEAVHIHDIRIAGSVFEAIKDMPIPVVLDLHDNFPEVMKEYPHLKKFPGKWIISPGKWKKKESEFMTMADKVVCVSHEMADQLKERVSAEAQKVVLVPNTVRKDFYTNYEVDKTLLKRFKNDFILLYIGDTGLRRGLLTAIEGLSLLREKIENLKLVIVGAGTEDRILKQKAVELKVSDAVVFEGWQEPDRFQSYIMASAVCLSPLNRSQQHDVAYANKLFQYMSFARPVLVSDAIAQKKLIEKQKSGLVHKEKDPEDFAEKVMKLYEDPVLRKECGARGLKFIDEVFRWELMSENLCNIYKEFSEV